MEKGISLHIGLNCVDPTHYSGWDGQLAACENDAHSMNQIATKLGYKSKVLLTKQATADAALNGVAEAAQLLAAGDMFFLTYSGHGGQVPDTNGDERDGKDETWVLFDREVIDDELYAMWAKFTPGVRVVVLSDSCHSGTVTRDYYDVTAPLERDLGLRSHGVFRPKRIPPAIGDKVYKEHKTLYDNIQKKYPDSEKVTVEATVLLISGCQDTQLSSDGDVNGLFTENLLKVWNGGQFTGDYHRFHDQIRHRMPPSQTPRLYVVGAHNKAFERGRPFVFATRVAAATGLR